MIRLHPSPVLDIYILELLRINDQINPFLVLDIYILVLLRVNDQIPSFSRPRYLYIRVTPGILSDDILLPS